MAEFGKPTLDDWKALADKEAWTSEVLNTVGALAVPAAGPYSGLVTIGLGMLATGLGVDNKRKGALIPTK